MGTNIERQPSSNNQQVVKPDQVITIIPIEGENPETGWRVELITTLPIELEDGTQVTQARIVRGDSKFFEATYLHPESEFNPQPWGQAGIIEHSQGREIVGQALVLLSQNPETHQVLVGATETPANRRIGARGQKPLLEGPRASIDNLANLQEVEIQLTADEPIYANTARITGDAPQGAPIEVGILILNEPVELENVTWMSLAEFAQQVHDAIAGTAALRALGVLGMLDNLQLPQQ